MYTFLIADNSTTLLDVLEFSLEKFRYRALVTSRVDQIFTDLEQNHVDVVLLNDMVEGKDGTVLAKQILSKYDVVLLMMSFSQNLELKLKAKNAGVMGWVVKPFIPERLIKIIVRTYFK